MVFGFGKGRTPYGDDIVGNVIWDEKSECFMGTNGYYWHGMKYGGWKETEPPPLDQRDQRQEEKKAIKAPQMRPPRGNDEVGTNVTYNFDFNCYATEHGYYWHGAKYGGWKETEPPPLDQRKLVPKEKKISVGVAPRMRPPRGNDKVGTEVTYNCDSNCFVTENSYYWHGTKYGGWKKSPLNYDLGGDEDIPKKKKDRVQPRMRPPRGNDKVGTEVTYNFDRKCYVTENNYHWHGTKSGGWKKRAPNDDLGDDDEIPEEKSVRVPPKMRPPKGNYQVGTKVTYNFDCKCYVTEDDYYWHGTKSGGWKESPPNDDSEDDEIPEEGNVSLKVNAPNDDSGDDEIPEENNVSLKAPNDNSEDDNEIPEKKNPRVAPKKRKRRSRGSR